MTKDNNIENGIYVNKRKHFKIKFYKWSQLSQSNNKYYNHKSIQSIIKYQTGTDLHIDYGFGKYTCKQLFFFFILVLPIKKYISLS